MRRALLAISLLALALACGRPTTPQSSKGKADFPHPATYGETATHGADAATSDAACSTCHTGTPGGPPACDSCHEDWPHDEGFRAGEVHGSSWLTDPTPCAACHGEDGQSTPAGALSAACTSCHSTYPHDIGWADATSHGPAVRARGGDAACSNCHDAEAEQAMTAPACESCHALYPHVDGWDHTAAWANDSGESCGSTCHPATASQGQVACSSCHDLFPHGDRWSTGHAAAVQQRGYATCRTCHEDGELLGPDLPKRCGSCHAGGDR